MAPDNGTPGSVGPELTARAAREKDAENMLGLMCRAFNMDAAVARRLFYADPFYDLSLKRILTNAGGAIVSCLTLIPSQLYLGGGVSLPICGVAGVCTEPELRNRGYAAELIDLAMSQIVSEFDFAAAALTAERPEFYRKLGWDFCGESVEIAMPARSIEQEARTEKACLEPSGALPSLASAIRDTYRRNRGEALPGAFGRDERRWRCITQSAAFRQIATYFEADRLSGYAAYSISPRQNSRERKIIVLHEVVADTAQQETALLQCLSQIDGCDELKGIFSRKQAQRLLAERDSSAPAKPGYPVLMRTVNLPYLVGKLVEANRTESKTGLPDCDFGIRITPSRGTGAESVSLTMKDGLIKTKAGAGDDEAAELIGDRGAITQLLLGYKSIAELLDAKRIEFRCRDTQAPASISQACERLFHRRDIFLAPLDLF